MGSSNEVLDISSDEEADSGDDGVIILTLKQWLQFSIADVKPLVKDLDDDDDCVILDGDPDKPVEIENDRANESDDVLVVGEKGQVACRDYPHPRYLCANFPFSTTPHESYCNQCYCYICDSVAPCHFWDNGYPKTDHCHATDKDHFWKLRRKCWRNTDKAPPTPPSVKSPQTNQLQLFSPPVSGLLNESDEPNDEATMLNPKQKFESSIAAVKTLVKDLDDDCVVLDVDQDKPVEMGNDRVNESDGLLLVGEKGQVACSDYPHPRHLCANFPFSTTPHESYCDQCHCYICDSAAPCQFWVKCFPEVVSGFPKRDDHCDATDKDQVWRLMRHFRKSINIAPPSPPSVGPPQTNQLQSFSPKVSNYVSPST